MVVSGGVLVKSLIVVWILWKIKNNIKYYFMVFLLYLANIPEIKTKEAYGRNK